MHCRQLLWWKNWVFHINSNDTAAGSRNMNKETFYIQLQDVSLDGCKSRIHKFIPAPGFTTENFELKKKKSKKGILAQTQLSQRFPQAKITLCLWRWAHSINSIFVGKLCSRIGPLICLISRAVGCVAQVGVPGDIYARQSGMWSDLTSRLRGQTSRGIVR